MEVPVGNVVFFCFIRDFLWYMSNKNVVRILAILLSKFCEDLRIHRHQLHFSSEDFNDGVGLQWFMHEV